MNRNREINPKNLKPESVKINNIADIRQAILPFVRDIPAGDGRVEFQSEIKWKDDDTNEDMKTIVSAHSSDVSMRKSLLDGLEQVKQQEILWNNMYATLEEDEYGATLPKPDIDKVHMPVDRIIKHRLGGEREGMTIVWYLNDRKVIFDPHAKTLNEYPNEP